MKTLRLWGICLLLTTYCIISQAREQIKIACIGNSITYGAGIKNRFQNSYPGILQQLLGEEYDVRNYGVSARVLLEKGDYPYMHEDAYRQVKAFQPDIVTIKLGTNDSKPHNWKYKKDFERDLNQMIDELQALDSHPSIIICLPVPAYEVKWGINDSTILNHITPILKRVAKKRKLQTIDLHEALSNKQALFPDHIHPNEEGAKQIAETIYRHLKGENPPYDYDTRQAFPGKKSNYNGFARYDFVCLGRQATIVQPTVPAKGNPWIWRPAFFNAFPSVDLALLKAGYHVAYYDLTHLYGSPRSMTLGKQFYDIMCKNYGLSDKVTVEGFSRGGYFAFNWAAKYPSTVASLYVDAPVCDITQWPGRERTELWNDFLHEWHKQDKDVDQNFAGNALTLLPKIAAARIPIIAVYGDADQTVDPRRNILPVFEAYRKLGAPIEIIGKAGVDHHPHSLENPEPVLDFILRYQKDYDKNHSINYRSDLSESFHRFATEKKGCVAFLGGSITEMNGWHQMIMEDLKQRFPETEFQFIEAGIASMGSTPHAFRFENDVLKHGTPDLLFFEAAVNDHENHFTATEQVRGVEGVVRHALRANPNMNILMMHFICDSQLDNLRKGIWPDVIFNHERVANHYGITTINMLHEIDTRMKNGEFDWTQFGGTHPSRFGHKYYTAAINRVFDYTQAHHRTKNPFNYANEPALDNACYQYGRFLDIRQAQALKGFRIVESWHPTDGKSTRRNFVDVPMLVADKAGNSIKLSFTGNAIGICCTAGPDAGILTYRIDNGEEKTIDTYTEWSHYLYLPWVYVLDSNLSNGQHTLYLKIGKGGRTGCQIRNFVVNQPE